MKPQQKIGPLGLRAKILSIIAVSVVIPLITSTVGTRIMGFRAYRKARGALFETIAVHYAKEIKGVLEGHARSLQEWATLSELPAAVAEMTRGPAPDAEELDEDVSYWEDRWPKGPMEDETAIQPFLTNEVARLTRVFQALNPQFVEILVADAEGRLVGATERTEDYFQADETWWQQAMRLRGYQAWIEGINIDKSAGVPSVDVAVVLFDPKRPRRPIGVVKGVLQAETAIGSLQPMLAQEQPISEVVVGEHPVLYGQVLVRLFEHGDPQKLMVASNVLTRVQQIDQGWDTMSLTGESEELVGWASLKRAQTLMGRFLVTGLSPIYVIVYEDLKSVQRPVRRQLRFFASAAGLLVLVFGLLALVLATRRIISPLQVLRAAANSISDTARLAEDEEASDAPDVQSDRQAREMVERVGRIDTGDEIEDLAIEFGRMADRVLNYHVQLQSELTEKTEEIQRDLVIAREFQEALLPKTYPEVPAPGAAAPLRLGFAHRYRAALSVGGDFFYVTRLTDHRAAAFITDVMGHGTRSALITAILRTLLYHLDPDLDNAASIMSYINRQFCQSVPHGKEFIFATAFCLVLDASSGEATCASAGHPPALRGSPSNREVVPLLTTRDVGPALGLSPESAYRDVKLRIEAGDLFLLYTDGLLEAPDVRHESFGEQRLRAVVGAHRDAAADPLCDAVMRAVARHMDTVVSPDDLCLAAVKVHRNPGHGHDADPAGTTA